MWDGMFLHPLGKAQLGFDWKCSWAKTVVSMYLRKSLKRKQTFSYPGAVAQQIFSLCLQVVTELGLAVSGCGSTSAWSSAGSAAAAWCGCE